MESRVVYTCTRELLQQYSKNQGDRAKCQSYCSRSLPVAYSAHMKIKNVFKILKKFKKNSEKKIKQKKGKKWI